MPSILVATNSNIKFKDKINQRPNPNWCYKAEIFLFAKQETLIQKEVIQTSGALSPKSL